MKRRVATNWKEKRFSRDGRGTTRWSLYFPQMEKGKRREAKRRRERWRSMWEMYVWTRKRGEINSRGLHGIGRIGVYFTENIPCNCNDDLYRDKRIDFLPRISPCPRRPKKGVHYTIYTSIIQGSVCALFSSRQFFTEIENPLKEDGYIDARFLHFISLSKNGFDESSAKVWRGSGWWKFFRSKHRVFTTGIFHNIAIRDGD